MIHLKLDPGYLAKQKKVGPGAHFLSLLFVHFDHAHFFHRCREMDFLKKVHETVEKGGKVVYLRIS